jgi:hypothetical protein
MTFKRCPTSPLLCARSVCPKFWPDGAISVSTLRNSIRKGLLQATMPDGKALVTEVWLAEPLNRCRVVKALPDCGSSLANLDERAGRARTERNPSALAWTPWPAPHHRQHTQGRRELREVFVLQQAGVDAGARLTIINLRRKNLVRGSGQSPR